MSLDKATQPGWLPVKWRQQESNLRQPECKSGALPTELYPLLGKIQFLYKSCRALNLYAHRS